MGAGSDERGQAEEAAARTRVPQADVCPGAGAAAAVPLPESLDDARLDVHRLAAAALARRRVTFATAADSAKCGTHGVIS